MRDRSLAEGTWLRSMRVRILAVVVGLLFLSSLGSVLLLREVLFDRLEAEIALELEQEAEEFRLLTSGNDPETGEPFDGDLRAIFDTYFAREVPDEGESLLSFIDGELYQSRRAQDAATTNDLDGAIAYWMALEEPDRGSIDTPFGEAQYIALPVRGQQEDGLFVVANFPAFERGEIDAAVQTQALIQLATLVVASLLGLALAGRVLRPLRSLAATARRITDTDFTQRIPVTGRDEASQIADAFNDMLGRLEAAFTTQRQFLDNTSHELRTPLTVIRGHVELLAIDQGPQERQESIALVVDEIDRMNHIVSDLFLLASAEHPDFVHVERLDLREVVLDVHRKAATLADRDWQVTAAEPVPVSADRHRLVQALLQLADNAVKFTADGDTISFGAGRDDGRARLWVRDEGTGVSPHDAGRIFERFNRGAVDRRTDGAGLGLAIVQAIADAHGGRVALVDNGEPGACFEITLPAR